MRYRMIYLAGLLIAASQIAGCASYQKQKQLEKVAKDWCMTIRASQVIPVYPLTEDLEPGDIFLVLNPIQTQAKQYKKQGFLRLDQRMGRLSGLDYRTFYQQSFGTEGHSDTPHHWQFPDTSRLPATAKRPDPNDPNVHRAYTHWHKAPHAAFPSYTFLAETSGSVQAALPIKGIPVGLGMIKADKASGSVTIDDAYTYGVPLDTLIDKVDQWASKSQNRQLLSDIRRGVVTGEPFLERLGRSLTGKAEKTIYLRVVNRVYLTGRVVVSLFNTTGGKVWGDIAQAQQSPTPRPAGPKDANNTKDANALEFIKKHDTDRAILDKYSQALEKYGFGAAFKAIWATERSVSISETFYRPLVIGYLGFDFPVLKDGSLGTPIATITQITGAATVKPFERTPKVSLSTQIILKPITVGFKTLKETDEEEHARLMAIANQRATAFKNKQSGKHFASFAEFVVGATPEQATEFREAWKKLRIEF